MRPAAKTLINLGLMMKMIGNINVWYLHLCYNYTITIITALCMDSEMKKKLPRDFDVENMNTFSD